MGTVITVPRDTRFRGVGKGVADFVREFTRQREEKKFQADFRKALDGLLTEEEQRIEKEIVPEDEFGRVREVDRVVTSEVPRTTQPTSLEVVRALGDFLAPSDVLNLLTRPGKTEKTPAQIKEEFKARRTGTLEADNEVVIQLTTAMDTARTSKNNRRANTIQKQIEKLTGKSLKTIESEAEAKKSGTLTARRENIQGILDSLNRGSTSVLASPQNVFGGTDTASTDAVAAVDLFIQARALTMSGESGLANSLITQANFLMDNSPSIRKQRELNKPVSPAVAAELGVHLGTTLGEVSELIPRSPEQVTQATSEAAALGKGIVKARQDLGFIDEARDTLGGLQGKLKTDPGLVGIRGTLRAKGKTVVGVLSDLGLSNFVDDAREIAAGAVGKDAGLIASLVSDPTLSVLDIIENSVGLILARLQTPTGRVPVEVIKRAIALVKLRGLTSSEQVIDRLNFIDGLLSSRESNIRSSFPDLLNEGGAIPPANIVPTPEQAPGEKLRRFRIQNGRLVEITDG